MQAAGPQNQDVVKFLPEPSLGAAKADLRSGKVDVAIVHATRSCSTKPAQSKHSPADPALVQDVAEYLGVLRAYQAAGLTRRAGPTGVLRQVASRPALQPGSKSATQATSVIGIVLLFLMLTQYCTWTLIGVMQEKSSRVVEVLLATVRPIQLLGGKVLGIGIVALGQAALIVGFALILGRRWAPTCCRAARRWHCCRNCSGSFSATPSTAGCTPRRARWPNARTRCRLSPCRSPSRSSWATSSRSLW